MRSIIFDSLKQEIYHVPNSVVEVISRLDQINLRSLYQEYQDQEKVLNQYIKFFVDANLVYVADSGRKTLPIDTVWESPYTISNVILEYGEYIKLHLPSIVSQFEVLHVQAVEIRIYHPIEINIILEMLDCFAASCVVSITLVVPYCPKLVGRITEIKSRSARITKLVVSDVPDTAEFDEEHYLGLDFTLIALSIAVDDSTCCGVINAHNFNYTLQAYLESRQANSCLNRKISIDTKGRIKVCPSMVEEFGNIHSTSLSEVLHEGSIQQYWTITKSQIDICNICEYRDVCSDCRAYTETSQPHGKPSKCNYDPYTMVWTS